MSSMVNSITPSSTLTDQSHPRRLLHLPQIPNKTHLRPSFTQRSFIASTFVVLKFDAIVSSFRISPIWFAFSALLSNDLWRDEKPWNGESNVDVFSVFSFPALNFGYGFRFTGVCKWGRFVIRYFFPIFSFILSARTCSNESYLVKIDGLYRLCWNNYLSKGSLWNCWFNMKKLCNWVISTWMFPICLWDLNRWCPKCLQVEFGWPQQCLAKLEYHSYESLPMVSCYMWWKRKCYTCVSLIRPTIFCFSN